MSVSTRVNPMTPIPLLVEKADAVTTATTRLRNALGEVSDAFLAVEAANERLHVAKRELSKVAAEQEDAQRSLVFAIENGRPR